MKSVLFFALTSLAANFAYAWPTVGDAANYTVNMNYAGQTASAQMQVVIKMINPSTDELFTEITTTLNGASNVQAETSKLSEAQQLATQVPMLVANCSAMGGTTESVTTPAGSFSTCKLATNGGFVWLADVVFGWVKLVETENGSTTEAILQSYKAN